MMRARVRSAVLIGLLGVSASALPRAQAQQQPTSPVVKLDPALDALLDANATLERLAGDFKPSLEGGVWIKKGQYLLFSNKSARLINKWTADAAVSVFLDLASVAKVDDPQVNLSSGTTLDAKGRLVYCSQGERAIVRVEPDGSRTVLVDSFEGERLGSPNDLVYKSDGALYFTDNPKTAVNSTYLFKDGRVRLISRELRRPNGIALSPDEKVLYVNDSGSGGKKCVWRFDIGADDMATNGRLWVDMSGDTARGVPDGMKVDTKGNVWDSGPGGVWILSPDGRRLGTVVTPDQVANLAFGDADGKSLFMTLHSALYRLRVKVAGLMP